MRIGIVAGFVALGLALQACSSSTPVQRELLVAAAPVPCAGDPAGTCLSVSEPNGDTWLMRFDEIDGFAYEPGFSYQLLVEEPPLNQELAVMPRPRLLRLIGREPVPGPQSGLLAGSWRLDSITSAGTGGQAQAFPGSAITARFHVDGGWVDGSAGCDSYVAALAVNGEKMTVSTPATTQQLCAPGAATHQRTYLQALAKAESYTVSGDRLEIRLLDGGAVQFRAAGG